MTSVAASFLAAFSAPSPTGSGGGAQPAGAGFGALLGATTPSQGGVASIPAAGDTTSPVAGLAALLATASVAAAATPGGSAPVLATSAAADPAPVPVADIPDAAPQDATATIPVDEVPVEPSGAAPVPITRAPRSSPPASAAGPRVADRASPNRELDVPPSAAADPAPADPLPAAGAERIDPEARTAIAAQPRAADVKARPPRSLLAAEAARRPDMQQPLADMTQRPVAADAPQTEAPATEAADHPKTPRAKGDRTPEDAIVALVVSPAPTLSAAAIVVPVATAAVAAPAVAPEAKPSAAASVRAVGTGVFAPPGQPAPASDQRVAASVEDRGDAGHGRDDEAASPPPTGQVSRLPAQHEGSRDGAAPFTLATPHPATAERASSPAAATITAQPGRIGQELGVAIAHHVASSPAGSAAIGGGDTITLRLNPVDMGRIEVKMSFDDGGTLRAVVSADNPAALDMLRRDSADLGRALADAGVRADAQTLRFDTRTDTGQGGGNGNAWQRQSEPRAGAMPDDGHAATSPGADDVAAAYRPLRTSGRVDMMA